MRIGIVFHKDPFVPPTGIDLIRLRAIAGGLRRTGVDAEIIAPAASTTAVEVVAAPQEPLVLAMAQAHRWQEMLSSGSYETAGDLAKHLRVSREYVTRTLSLNYLAPDIVQAILDGREPSGLSMGKLARPLPLLWNEQRARLGFAC